MQLTWYWQTLQNYILAFDAWGDVNGTGNLNIDAYKSSIKVVKVDAETKNPIENLPLIFIRVIEKQNYIMQARNHFLHVNFSSFASS